MATRNCPQCDCEISDQAKKCPECLSDIANESRSKKTLAAFGKAAAIFRDWVGVPVAIVALVTAFFYPAIGTVLGWLGRDRAAITIKLFNPDVVNVGLDDQAGANRVDRVTMRDSLFRGQLINDGYSLGSVQSTFFCTGPKQPAGRLIHNFSFHDPSRGTKSFPEVAGRTSVSFFARHRDSGVYQTPNDPFAPLEPNKCMFTYSDKFGAAPPVILDLTKQQVSILPSMARRDDSEEWIEKYCQGIANVILSDKNKADCLSGTHVIAIEPTNRWAAALSRSLAYAKSFSELTQTRRSAGIILACYDDDCGTDSGEPTAAFKSLGIPLTVWWCKPSHGALKNCERKDFSTADRAD
jgi:hypothetical protein